MLALSSYSRTTERRSESPDVQFTKIEIFQSSRLTSTYVRSQPLRKATWESAGRRRRRSRSAGPPPSACTPPGRSRWPAAWSVASRRRDGRGDRGWRNQRCQRQLLQRGSNGVIRQLAPRAKNRRRELKLDGLQEREALLGLRCKSWNWNLSSNSVAVKT